MDGIHPFSQIYYPDKIILPFNQSSALINSHQNQMHLSNSLVTCYHRVPATDGLDRYAPGVETHHENRY